MNILPKYLPQFGQNEIEIVRIVLASVTQDVISIRVRCSGKGIAYRVVDEYDTEFASTRKPSSRPFSFREVIRFIDQTNHEEEPDGNGLVFSVIDMSIEGSGDPESLRGFVSVCSNFYPELERYYDAATDRYLDQFMIEDEDDVA